MPETSIVVKATDRYSDAVKKMATVTKSFSKDVDSLEEGLYALNKNKYTLKLDVKNAKQALNEAEKQFAKTRSEADGLKMELAQANYDNAVRNLNAVTRAARDTEKEISKVTNKSGGGGGMSGGFKSISNALVAMQAAQMIGSAVQGAVNVGIGSALGDDAGAFASSMISSVISGAVTGSAFGPSGALAGAAAGGIVGLVSGSAKSYEARDSAFKSYVQEAAEGQLSAQETALSTGSSLAAGRETDLISFSTLFGGREKAEGYLKNLVQMANTTPFLYDDLTAMSKTLATYGYDETSILPVLQTIGDTGAALGQDTSDMTAVATALGRMKSSNKTTLEYLNILNDRGIGAVGMLADAKGVSQKTMYDMISKGQIAGQDAADIILTALTEKFAGSMEAQSKTFSGITSTVQGLEQELDNAMGEGYNQGRIQGLEAQRDWLSGESGQEVMEANKAIGAWKAELENSKEQYIRDAVDAMMASEDYQAAKTAGDAAEMGRLIMQAKVQGMNEYNASEGAQEALEAEKTLVDNIRNDTSVNRDYWDAGYEKGQIFSRGMAAGMGSVIMRYDGEGYGSTAEYDEWGNPYAVGLSYVPYDNFPALLHQGERVLTAQEARSADGGSRVVEITGNQFVIREDADVDRIAAALLEQLEMAELRG